MLEITQSIDKYVMQERLGQSSTAEVWRAFDQTLQRSVIIKFLRISQQKHAHSIQRLQQNFSILVSLRHPNIIQIYDISSRARISGQFENSSAYVVMPDIAGSTLADYAVYALKEGKKPSVLEIAQLFVTIGSALDYAHQRGVIHSSIKPANILLDQQNTTFLMGEPVLTDFGLTSLEDSAHVGERLSLYAAPEQALKGVVTEQCDIYALGIILYELYTGKHPFEDLGQGADQKLVTAILDPIPPSRVNQEISPALESVILQSIAREPEERFADVRTMVLALLQALNVPPSPSLCMEYHVSFLELLQKQAEEARDSVMVSEIIDAQKLFEQKELSDAGEKDILGEKDLVGRATLYGGPAAMSAIVHPLPGPQQGEARPTFRRAYEYRFIPLSIIPLFLIASTFLWSLGGVGQAAQGVGGPPGQTITGVPSGSLSFLSSGQGDQTKDQGVNDEVSVNLINIAPPMSQKSYDVWLQADVSISDNSPLWLGRLNVSHDSAHFLYKEPQHRDLLATWSRFLVTEEDANVLPVGPSLEATKQVAVGEISQDPAPGDQKQYSALDHIRHLQAADPDLNKLHLQGGLSFWLKYSTQIMLGHAQNAEKKFSAKDATGLHDQLVRLLDDIEGDKMLADNVPRNMRLSDGAFAQVGLLQVPSNPDLSYLSHINMHLRGLVNAPGVMPNQQHIADAIVPVIDAVNALLEQIKTAALPLLTLSPQQLLQPSVGSKLAAIANMAKVAYQGEENVPGVLWISAQIALLATIRVHT